jgi:hypothetical protein
MPTKFSWTNRVQTIKNGRILNLLTDLFLYFVQARLYKLQCRPSLRTALREAQLIQPLAAGTQPHGLTAACRPEGRTGAAGGPAEGQPGFEEENPAVLPRLPLFPELPEAAGQLKAGEESLTKIAGGGGGVATSE